MTVRRQYVLTNEAIDLVSHYAPSERKQGEWLSQMIEKYHSLLNEDLSIPQCGHLESIDLTLEIVRLQNAAILRRLDEVLPK